MFDTLYGVDAKLRARPQMAEGHTISDDGRTWLIRLRDGLKFHDGEPVLARDCAASLKRWSARDVFGQTAATFVEEWGTADDRTIRVTLKSPFPLLAIADLETMDLDVLAMQQGYQRPALRNFGAPMPRTDRAATG